MGDWVTLYLHHGGGFVYKEEFGDFIYVGGEFHKWDVDIDMLAYYELVQVAQTGLGYHAVEMQIFYKQPGRSFKDGLKPLRNNQTVGDMIKFDATRQYHIYLVHGIDSHTECSFEEVAKAQSKSERNFINLSDEEKSEQPPEMATVPLLLNMRTHGARVCLKRPAKKLKRRRFRAVKKVKVRSNGNATVLPVEVRNEVDDTATEADNPVEVGNEVDDAVNEANNPVEVGNEVDDTVTEADNPVQVGNEVDDTVTEANNPVEIGNEVDGVDVVYDVPASPRVEAASDGTTISSGDEDDYSTDSGISVPPDWYEAGPSQPAISESDSDYEMPQWEHGYGSSDSLEVFSSNVYDSSYFLIQKDS